MRRLRMFGQRFAATVAHFGMLSQRFERTSAILGCLAKALAKCSSIFGCLTKAFQELEHLAMFGYRSHLRASVDIWPKAQQTFRHALAVVQKVVELLDFSEIFENV